MAFNTLAAAVQYHLQTQQQVSQAQPVQTPGIPSGIKSGLDNLPTLAATSVDFYPTINSTLNTTNPGPVQWTQTRPTLTGGIAGGRMSGGWRFLFHQNNKGRVELTCHCQAPLHRSPGLPMIPPS
jgi:hypothetical protein